MASPLARLAARACAALGESTAALSDRLFGAADRLYPPPVVEFEVSMSTVNDARALMSAIRRARDDGDHERVNRLVREFDAVMAAITVVPRG